ncbi:MAG: uncharacterized membrane protein YdcZ (DUF606 family), partial [Candidatus Pelagisphaera sp.]
MQQLPLILIMVFGGVCLAIQPSTNARMAQHVGVLG